MDDLLEFYKKHKIQINLGKMSTLEFWQECVENFGLKKTEGFDLPKWWVADYKVIETIHNLIYSLEDKVEIGIISNSSTGIWEAALNDGLVPRIKYKQVLLSCNLGIKKPDSQIFELAQNKAGVEPWEILFVDDQMKNLVIPKEMGWGTVLFDQTNAEIGVKQIVNQL